MPGPPGPQGAAVSDYFDLGSIIPAKAHANDPIFTGLVFLKPRSGSICSPQSDKNTEGRGAGGGTGVMSSVNLAVLCFLGTLPG